MNKFEKTASVFCGLLLLAYLFSSFFLEQRLWGINHLAYFSFPFRGTILLIALVLLLPPLSGRIIPRTTGFCHSLADRSNRRILKYTFFSLVSVSIFWIFRTKTHFLGDGYLRARDLAGGVRYLPAEPLDYYLHFLAQKFLSPLWGGDPIKTYSILSCVAGGIFVFFAFLLADYLSKTAPGKCLIFIGLITLGGSQLFFGYVESYSLMYGGVLIYLLLSLYFLEGKINLIWPTLSLGLTFALHLSTFYLLPSLAYLYWLKNKKELTKHKAILNFWTLFSFSLFISGLGVGIFLLRELTTGRWGINLYPMFLSIKKIGNDPYTLFSGSHLVDFINELLLLSPVSIIIWLVIIFYFRRQSNWKSRTVIFLGMVSFFSLVYTFMANPKLACARDWDMFAPTGLGFTLLGLYLLIQNIRKEENLRHLLLVFSVTLLVGSLPWFYLNSNEVKSLARFNNILNLDPQRSAYGHETLARYYGDLGLYEKEAEEWMKAIALEKNPRFFNNLGIALFELNRYDEAIIEYRKALELNPRSAKAHYNLGLAYFRKEMWGEAINEYKKAKELGLRLANLHAELGKAYEKEKLYPDGILELKIAIQMDPKVAEYHYYLGSFLFETKQIEESIKALKHTVSLDSTYSLAHKTLGEIYLVKGDSQEALRHYKLYLKHNPEAEDKTQIEQILLKLEKN